MTKAAFKKLAQYWLEVSIVMIGVAITLSVSYWIEQRGETKDMALYMRAVRLELEENRKTLDSAIEELKPMVAYSDYLRSNDLGSLNRDSLDSYGHLHYRVTPYSFKTNAFEMFKNSGGMRLVRDKQMLLTLWDIYDSFDVLKKQFDWFNEAKWNDMRSEISLLIAGRKVEAPMYEFYLMAMPAVVLRQCEAVSKSLGEFSFRE